MAQYVVIGNGVAAVGCIEGIRKEDAAGKIIVISEEPHPVYCRPLISYYLEGKTNLEKMAYRDKNFYERMGCEILYGKKAAQIDPSTKQIALNDDTVIPYDKLCIATGSSAGSYYTAEQGCELYEEKSEGTLKRLFTRGDYLTGFILIGATERAGIYTSLIRERIPLSSIDFEMLKKTATSTEFSVEKRKQFFGGVV